MSGTEEDNKSEFRRAVARYAVECATKYRGETIILKFGGELVAQPDVVDTIMEQAVMLKSFGANPILIHGGGNQIDQELQKAKIKPKKRDGVRDTDAQTLEITDRCLADLNRELGIACCNKANKKNISAFPMAGYDGGIIKAVPKFENSQTGSVTLVNVDRLNVLMDNQTIPIIYPICQGENGLRMNVNADEVAASLAMALGARRLIICSNTQGVLDKNGNRIAQIDTSQVEELISAEVITGGMIPKVRACKNVAEHPNVGGVVILKGDQPDAIERELLSEEGSGTLIQCSATKAPAFQPAVA
ncbi:MAG: acetylglutamate kinase [Alphaproteobacteria bacterium]|nr:acetylglutamate kinase [Alphaproteobacteria bacterium]